MTQHPDGTVTLTAEEVENLVEWLREIRRLSRPVTQQIVDLALSLLSARKEPGDG